jgi:hypothetical protein
MGISERGYNSRHTLEMKMTWPVEIRRGVFSSGLLTHVELPVVFTELPDTSVEGG